MQKKVLIVSDDAEFTEALWQSWQRAGRTPEFEVATRAKAGEAQGSSVAVLDGSEALLRLAAAVPLAIAITDEEPLPETPGAGRRVVRITRAKGWAEIAAALVLESVLREEAQQRAEDAEGRLQQSERFCALGRFIAGESHGLANALTSVLGHSELMMMEEGVPDEVRQRLATIHASSMGIHGILQRLSGLDRELQMAERRAERSLLEKPAGKTASE